MKNLIFKVRIYGEHKISRDNLGFAMNENGSISDIEYNEGNTFITLEIGAVDKYLLKVAIKNLTEDCDYNILGIENIGNKNKYSEEAIEMANKYLDNYNNGKENKISGWVYFYNKTYKFPKKGYNHYGDTNNVELSTRWAKEAGGINGPENFYSVYIYDKTNDEFLKECEDLVKKGSEIVGFNTLGRNKNAKKYQYVIKVMKNKYKLKNEFIKGHFE